MTTQLPFDELDPTPTSDDEVGTGTGEPPDAIDADTAVYVDDPGEATDRLLEVIAAVDFLRRGDQRDLTLWAAIEEALRWWIAERTALLDGHTEPVMPPPRIGDDDPLRATLTQLLAVTGQDEPVHISVALQQALRRWTTSAADRYNDGHPWPDPPARRGFPPSLRLADTFVGDGEPPDLIA